MSSKNQLTDRGVKVGILCYPPKVYQFGQLRLIFTTKLTPSIRERKGGNRPHELAFLNCNSENFNTLPE